MEKFNVQSIIASNKYLIPENADMNIITKIVKKNPNIFKFYDSPRTLSKLYKEVVVNNIAAVFKNYKYDVSTGYFEDCIGKRNIFKCSEFGDELGRISYGVFTNGRRIAEFSNKDIASSVVTKINDIANNYSSICWL